MRILPLDQHFELVKALLSIVDFGCATWKWKLRRPPVLPMIFKPAVEIAASQSNDFVCSAYRPDHSGLFEPFAESPFCSPPQ